MVLAIAFGIVIGGVVLFALKKIWDLLWDCYRI